MSYRNLQSGILLTLLCFGVVTTTGCEEGTSERDTTRTLPTQYHFQAKYEDVAGLTEVLINGFPVNRAGGSITNNPIVPHDLNTALIGKGNELTIRVEPRMLRGSGLSISTVKVCGKVTRDYEGKYPVSGAEITESEVDSAYEAWSKRAQKKWETYRSTVEHGALDSIRVWASRHPMKVSTTFDNEAGPDFSRIFEEAPVLEDTPATRKRLKDFAIRLRDWMAAQDTSALVQAYLPSFWQGRRPLDLAALPKQIGAEKMAEVRDYVVMNNPYLKFDRSDVALRKWSDGRVWELYHGPDQAPLFVVPSMRESSEKYTGIGTIRDTYVAKIGSRLRVVRD